MTNAAAATRPDAASTSGTPPETERWERRFVSPPDRIFEHVELYNSLGYEVRLEPVPPEELQGDCSGCLVALSLYRVVYTRRPE